MKLWEIDHPYYCTEGCFFFSPARHGDKWETHSTCESWSAFFRDWGSADEDLNLVFRWDWHKPDPDDYGWEIEHDPEFEMPGARRNDAAAVGAAAGRCVMTAAGWTLLAAAGFLTAYGIGLAIANAARIGDEGLGWLDDEDDEVQP